MYTLVFESETHKPYKIKNMETLDEIFTKTPNKIEVKRYDLADIYDQVDYGINILKPVNNKEDFIFIYTHPVYWDYYKKDLHNYLIGRSVKEVFSNFKITNQMHKFLLKAYKKKSFKSLIKLYEDNKLIKVWSILNLTKDELIYVCIKDETDFYIEKEKEETVFNSSAFPILEVNREKKIVRVNKAYREYLGYTLKEINELGTGSTLVSYKSQHNNINNFLDSLDLIFNKTIKHDDAEVELINKNGEHKWLNGHLRLISNDIVQITLRDLTELKQTQNSAVNLNEYLSDMEEVSKTCLTIKDNEGYHWTSEIYTILELDKTTNINTTKENLLSKYTTKENQQKNREKLKKLSLTNPITIEYDIKTLKGNYKHLKSFIKLKKQDKQTIQLSFTQDTTEEYLAKKSAFTLKENIEYLEGFSKIVIAEFNKNNTYYTSEIYNILEANPEEYTPEELDQLVNPEDLEIFNENLKNINKKNPTFKQIYKCKTPKGNLRVLSANAIGKFQDNGELIKTVCFIQDITEQAQAQQEAYNLEKSLKHISEFSKIVIATYENGKYTWTDEIYNILKINPKNYNKNQGILKQFENPKENKKFFEKIFNLTPENNTYSTIRNIKDNEGNKKYLNCEVVADFNKKGQPKFYGFLQDITEELKTQESALQLQKDLNIIQSSSKIIIAHHKNGKHYFTNEIYNILEINPQEHPTSEELVKNYLQNKFNQKFIKKILQINPKNPYIHDIVKVKTQTGKIKILECFIEAEFDENNQLKEIVGLLQEITDKVEREEKLKQLSEDRKILLQEVHHRVKNNLQLILSFLSLETRYHKKDPEYVIEQTKNRIQTMALTHEEIYQSPSVSKVNLESFFEKGLNNIFHLYSEKKITPHLNIESIELDVDKSIPLGLLVNELALNTIKYAFPKSPKGDFYINIKTQDESIVLKVWDNGIGLKDNFNIQDSTGLGFIIVRNLTQQLEGELIQLKDIDGFGLKIIFPKNIETPFQ